MPFDTDCWEWTRAKTPAGYGVTQFNGKLQYVHRLVAEAPKGLVVDHLCSNPSCYNPRHLEVVTDWENRARGRSKSAVVMRTNHCHRGHEFTPENTFIKTNGYRACRECGRMHVRSRRARAKERLNADV